MEIYYTTLGGHPRVCGYKAEKPKKQTKDPNVESFKKKPTIYEAAYFHEGFQLCDDVYVIKDGELVTRYSFPRYSVYFPRAKATYKKCWELCEDQLESDDDYRDAMRAHYRRMDPKKEVVYPRINKNYLRPDPYNFCQRMHLCNGTRFYNDDYKRMFVSEHYFGNPQRQTEFNYSDVEEKEEEIDFMGVGPEGKGKNKKERVYWMGQVYLKNLHNGRRKTGALKTLISKYFNISERSVINYAQFADSCNTLSKDGDGSKMSNTMRKKTVTEAKKYSTKFFDWVLKPFPYGKRPKPWETFEGERGYYVKEATLRK